jgi:hypothetical protein
LKQRYGNLFPAELGRDWLTRRRSEGSARQRLGGGGSATELAEQPAAHSITPPALPRLSAADKMFGTEFRLQFCRFRREEYKSVYLSAIIAFLPSDRRQESPPGGSPLIRGCVQAGSAG